MDRGFFKNTYFIVVTIVILIAVMTGISYFTSNLGYSPNELNIDKQDLQELDQAIRRASELAADASQKEEHVIPPYKKDLAIEEARQKIEREGSANIVIILKDEGNRYIEDNYVENFDKKRIEISKLKNKFLDGFIKGEIKLNQEGIVTRFVAFNVDLDLLDKVENNYYYDYLFLDKEVQLALTESRSLIQADLVENNLGLTGQGVTVCVLDTGIDYTHPALGGCTTQQFLAGNCNKVVGGYDFCQSVSAGVCTGANNDPIDPWGHGTHVAGIIASTNNVYRGVAPDAKLAAVKVIGVGGGTQSSAMAGIDWCVNNQNSFSDSIKIITMSFGDLGNWNSMTSPAYYDPSIQTALSAGIFLDASSGNQGIGNPLLAPISGINYPAVAPGVTSVGAVYDANVGSQSWIHTSPTSPLCTDSITQSDLVTCYTNRNEELDVLAPGSIISSSFPSVPCLSNSPAPGFCDEGGTSMAAPHVAGVAALLLEQNPNLMPSQIDTILKSTGVLINVPYHNNPLTIPRIDAFAAVNGLNQQYLTVTGTLSAGSTLSFEISDPSNPGLAYILALSDSTNPGIILPQGTIPLNYNTLLVDSILNPSNYGFQNSIGLLDSSGLASASLTIPQYTSPGTTISFAFVTVDTSLAFPQNVVGISPAITLTSV